jgi:hypothetical protein
MINLPSLDINYKWHLTISSDVDKTAIVNIVNPSTERALVRTMASASRTLNEDLDLSPLQAIDRVQKLDTKFAEHWYGHPWLVLQDGYTLPAHMPVAKMLEEIGKHGRAIGIVGVAQITTRQDSVFAMNFCKDAVSRKMVENSRKQAAELLEKANKRAAELNKEIVETTLRATHKSKGGQE